MLRIYPKKVKAQDMVTKELTDINAIKGDKGDSGGSDVTMKDNPQRGIDLKVGDVTKTLTKQSDIDKMDTLVETDSPSIYNFVEEKDISYSAIPVYCGKWVDGKAIHRRVYVVTDGIAKDNTIKVADKPSNMVLLIRGFGIVEGTANATKHTMTNSDVTVYVNDDGVYCVNNFTGYAERIYVVLEYTVSEG